LPPFVYAIISSQKFTYITYKWGKSSLVRASYVGVSLETYPVSVNRTFNHTLTERLQQRVVD